MRSRGRTVLPAVLLSATLGLTGCTDHGGSVPPSSPPASGAVVASNVEVKFKPGEYQYVFGNITASFSFRGSDGTLHILNQTAGDIGPPGLYVITGDDRRFDGKVADPSTIPNAGDMQFEVTFPPEVTEKTVGLLVLTLGAYNMGAMAPAPESPSP